MAGLLQLFVEGALSTLMGKGPYHLTKEREKREALEAARKKQLLQRKLAEVAIRAYKKAREDDSRRGPDGEKAGRDLQYVDDDVRVEVINGYSRDYDQFTTDILLYPRDGSGDRHHIVFGENGSELVNEWHEKKK